MPNQGKVREVPFAELARFHKEQRAECEAIQWLLLHMADDLPPDSATAKAIGRQGTWGEILRLAQWEGVFEISILLEEAAATLGPEVLGERATSRKFDA